MTCGHPVTGILIIENMFKITTHTPKVIIFAAVCGVMTSCFKDEPLNAECDIEQAYVHVDDPQLLFFSPSDTLINVKSDMSNIVFNIKEGTDLSVLAPVLKITEGATVSPESGTVHDFSDGRAVVYTVTSQDGQWSRKYNISFKTYDPVSMYNFEHTSFVKVKDDAGYFTWHELNPDGTELPIWATGNPGFRLSMSTAKPDEYPTAPIADGYDGAAVKLVTRSTGSLGEMVKMPLAAGNLFTGTFNVGSALINAMKATRFGVPYTHKPLRLTGWYKYRPGEIYKDKQGNEVTGRTDKGDIYAVLYDNHDNTGNAVTLDGSNVKTSPLIVAIAQVQEVKTTDEWTPFMADFEYKADIDPDKLKNQGYSLAVVFTSSEEGASFCGAIGSTLCIDKVIVDYEEQ